MNRKFVYPFFQEDGTCKFCVWAPKASSVQLILSDPECVSPMVREDYGYWSTVVDNVSSGRRYKYIINDSQSFPDPASLSQPDGVHGASEFIDLKDFNWDDGNWKNIPLKTMVQYELHIGTFSPEGTFNSVIQKLDYLVDLGVNAIEILPVSQFSGERNWGYDGVYPFATQSTYGGAYELMKLVNECHKRDIAVILDVVYNHFGPEGCYLSNFGQYFVGKYSTPWGNPVNFDDQYSDGVRNFIVQNALMWLRDFHIDGLRLDAIHAIYDFSARHILQELSENVEELSESLKKPLYLIGESHLNDVRHISPVYKGGYGLTGQWSDDFHHAVHAMTTSEKNGYYIDFGSPDQLAKAIKDVFVYDGKYSEFRKKTYGNSTESNPGEQFVIFNQNHDQVGNRKFGERLISLVGFERAKLIAACMFITPNIPMLFMGEEYGERNPFLYFVSHLDKKLNKLVRQGRNREFKDFYKDDKEAPHPDDPKTFNQSKLSWNIEQNAEKQAMFNYYKALIKLRKENPVLQNVDKKNIKIVQQDHVFILERWHDNHHLFAFMNFSGSSREVSLPDTIPENLKLIIDSTDSEWQGKGSEIKGKIHGGQKLYLSEKTILIYSN